MDYSPYLSIITVVYNNCFTIDRALNSVKNQTYRNKEHVVIDGGSTDGTIEKILAHGNSISKFVTEPDNGIYDALNKGIRISEGEIIGILHADDSFNSEYTLEHVAELFKNSEVIAVYGDLLYVSAYDSSKVIRYWKSGRFCKKLLKKGWMPPHPTLFVRRKVFDEIGFYNTKYSIAADYDFMVRLLKSYDESSFVYLPEVITRMNTGGKSNRSIGNICRKSYEDYCIIKENKIGGLVTLFLKNIGKLNQFIRMK